MLAFLIAVLPATVFGQQGNTEPSQAEILARLYNKAMSDFQKGDWGGAASGLENFVKQVPNEGQAQIAPAYFTMGAAYYNMPNYPKAIEVFKGFIDKFPKSDKLLDARLLLGQCHLAAKQYDLALKIYAELESIPAIREQALMAEVTAYRMMKKPDDAIRTLEKLVGNEIKSTVQANGAVMLIEMYSDKGLTDKASAMLEKVQAKLAIIDNLVGLNMVAIKLADEFADKRRYKEAISCYRMVRSRDDVVKFQQDRIAAMEKRIEYNSRVGTADPQLYVKANQQNNVLKGQVEESKALLAEFLKLPDYASSLLYRIARCWYEWDKKWEAMVVYQQLLEKYPNSPEREPCLFGIVIAFGELNRIKSTQAACDVYLKEFPNSENASTVGYMSGAVALQAGDYEGASTFFGTMLEKQPNSTYREQMIFLLGNAKFAQGKYDESTKQYERYLEAFPKGGNAEEVMFRLAVTKVFTGDYEQALKALNEYVAEYPKGFYLPDARYRIAVCYYAASQFEDVAKQCEKWVADFPEDGMQGEVQALLGDAYAAVNREEDAIRAYKVSFKKAQTDEVLNYSLFEASKHMQKLGMWDEMSDMFTEFVKDKPDHPSIIAAMYWIGKAKARKGQVDEAKELMVENLKKYIAEPKREAVEQLLAQLAQLCSKRPRPPVVVETPAEPVAPVTPPADPAAPAPVATVESTPPPEPPPYDAFAELDKQLKPLEEGATPTTKARLLYARAEMAAIKKQDAVREKMLREMAERFKPEELSPVLLSLVGDFLLEKGETDRATTIFNLMRENFPKSDHLDVAYVGLGEIAFKKKDYETALGLFTDALEKVSASMKMKEATIGKAKTLLELGKFDESKKLFEQVAGIREWRGDATAFAVYSLGEIEARQNRLPEAIAFYRRVFVAYQKYLPWVAKSYLKAAETFNKMGQRQDAIDNLREMLRNEKLQKLPEFDQAKKKLEEWGGGPA